MIPACSGWKLLQEKSFGTEHPNFATALNNLAGLLQATNRLSEAEPLMRQALAIDQQSFEPGHPETAATLYNLARLLQDTNRVEEAQPLMRFVLCIFHDFTLYTGRKHPHLGEAFDNYRRLLRGDGRIRP